MKWDNPVPGKPPRTQQTPPPWQACPANSTSRPDPTESDTKQAPADLGIRPTQLLTQAPDWALWPQAPGDSDPRLPSWYWHSICSSRTKIHQQDHPETHNWLKDTWFSLPKLFYKVRQRHLPLQMYRHQHKVLITNNQGNMTPQEQNKAPVNGTKEILGWVW